MDENQYVFLQKLLAQPTAPFRELFVKRCVTEQLNLGRVPYFEDPLGNIVIGVKNKDAYLCLLRSRATSPVRLYIAHMDHPGFHGVRWLDQGRLKIKWFGGSPVKRINGSRVWLATEHGIFAKGTLAKSVIATHGHGIDTAEVRLESSAAYTREAARRVFGAFQFRAPVWRAGKRIYTNAADDLIGVFSLVQTALSLFAKRARQDVPPFIGLLTRAEEVGFVGAIGHFELGWHKRANRPLFCVSLEASRTLDNAEIGLGPIVRLGDRRTVFDANGIQMLTHIAEKTLGTDFQRRIMDGGACEGTASTAYGLPTIALSIPLGNYHNQGFEGGQDCTYPGGPAPEFVHIDDVERLMRLCRAIMNSRISWADPWRSTRVRLKKNYQELKSLL